MRGLRPWPWPDEPPLVLAVDDQDPNLRLLGRVLTEAGFDVMPAASGERALQRLDAALPDVVLLDLRMRGLDGFEVLKRIRAEPRWMAIPVLMLTAAHERESVMQALVAGADDYLLKPFEPNELLARVRLHAELQRWRRDSP